MIKYTTDETKNIYSIKTATRGTKLHLDWLYNGFSQFLILYGDNARAVNLCENELRELFSELMTDDFVSKLSEEKTVVFKQEKLTVFLYTHGEIKRDGGMQIKENPGVYAVYGAEINGNDITVYTADCTANARNMNTVHIDVTIEQKPHYVEKRSFLKKTTVYSGYRIVRLAKAYPALTGGVLRYRINDYSFPFPDSIVKSGGAFYVKADENIAIEFSTNNPGIRIK